MQENVLSYSASKHWNLTMYCNNVQLLWNKGLARFTNIDLRKAVSSKVNLFFLHLIKTEVSELLNFK